MVTFNKKSGFTTLSKSRYHQDATRGFTLIELIVSIGVLAVLSTFAILSLNPFSQFQKSNDAKRKADLSEVQKALEQYYQDHQAYPLSSNTYKIKDFQNAIVDWGKITDAWRIYMVLLPKDPANPSRSYAYYSSDGQSYWLYASLERGSQDSQSCGVQCGSITINNISTTACGANVKCNFSLRSPNVTTP